MSHLTTWLEKQAKGWLERGLSRVPVESKPNIGWSASGVLTSGRSQQSVSLQVDLSNQIQPHTIQFDGFDNELSVGARPDTCKAEAEILWSVKGTTIRRLVTVLDGLSVTGMAQAVTVNIRDASADRDFSGFFREYRVGMVVVPGVRPSTGQPPMLQLAGLKNRSGYGGGIETPFPWSDICAPGDMLEWYVPSNCGATQVMLRVGVSTPGTSLLNGDVKIEHQSSNTAEIWIAGGEEVNRWVPLLPGTRRFELKSSVSVRASCILGIDG